MNENEIPARPARLKFIDLARALAILLMLEGHFVGLALADMDSYRGNPLFEVWGRIRGFTAPLFFTVAGMIFCFLLSGETEGKFFKRVRVRKGLRRAAELFFWGVRSAAFPEKFRKLSEAGFWGMGFRLPCFAMHRRGSAWADGCCCLAE